MNEPTTEEIKRQFSDALATIAQLTKERDELKAQLHIRYSDSAAAYGRLTEDFVAMRTERDQLSAKCAEMREALRLMILLWEAHGSGGDHACHYKAKQALEAFGK